MTALPGINPQYPGFNVLLMGPTGTGKTYSISTLVETGLEVFYLGIEPGLETLIGSFTDPAPKGKGLKELPPNLHWHYLQPRTMGFGQLQKVSDDIAKMDLSALAKVKDSQRSKSNVVYDLYGVLNDFSDQRTGKTYGCVDTWGNDRVIVFDSLTALSWIMMQMVVGTRPMRDKPDYGISQNNLMQLIHKMTSGCNCHFVLLAHDDREVDEVLGGVKRMPKSIGKALVSEIQQPFSDVILSERQGDKFFWDTANSQADLKTRNLPIAAKLPADFRAIFNSWASRARVASSQVQK